MVKDSHPQDLFSSTLEVNSDGFTMMKLMWNHDEIMMKLYEAPLQSRPGEVAPAWAQPPCTTASAMLPWAGLGKTDRVGHSRRLHAWCPGILIYSMCSLSYIIAYYCITCYNIVSNHICIKFFNIILCTVYIFCFIIWSHILSKHYICIHCVCIYIYIYR